MHTWAAISALEAFQHIIGMVALWVVVSSSMGFQISFWSRVVSRNSKSKTAYMHVQTSTSASPWEWRHSAEICISKSDFKFF
jgi:hypothetical protein